MNTTIPIGFYPFWFWNDRLSAEEIRWQVREMAEKGIRGFFIHSRQGLQQPYLSEAFFEMVDVAMEAAEEYGLYVHLYDEYPYPSGIAGGEVVLGCPQFYATKLVQRSYVVEGGYVRLELPPGKVLACWVYPLEDGKVEWSKGVDLCDYVGPVLARDSYVETGLTRYNQKRYFASEPTPTLEATLTGGPHKLFVSVQAEVNHSKYWDHYVDVLNPEAMARWRELTHERYRKRYAVQFGKRIISIFTDETEPRWSERIPAAFLAEYGYDLAEYLPALQDASHPDHVKVSYDLYRLRYKLFCEAFEQPLSAWCRANDLAYSGEKPSLRMAQLRYMDIPGCEPGHIKAGARMDLLSPRLRQNARATACAAYFYGKGGSLCECYHSTGWSATLQDAKLIADGLLLLGIRYLVPHGFFYSTHALKKHDAPPTFFFQMPFWPLFGRLAERIGRIGELFEGTHMDAEVLVVDQTSGMPGHEDLLTYEAMLALLMENHLDFQIVDTDILQESHVEAGRVYAADIAVRVVLVPPMQVVEAPLRKWLAEYEAVGGTAIRVDRGQALDEVRDALLEEVEPSLSVRHDGKEVADVQVVKRVGAGKTLWFVLNTGSERVTAELDSGGGLREIPLEDDLPPFLEKREGRYMRTIRPFESFMLEAAAQDDVTEPLPRVVVGVGGAARVHPENPNLLRMYEWQMSLLDQDGEELQTAKVPAVPLVNQLDAGGFRYAPKVHHYFGHLPELSLPELRVRYVYTFTSNYDGPVELVMEPGSIVGEWAIYVNNSGPIVAADMQPTGAHVRGSLGTEVTPFLRQGENTVRVEVTVEGSNGGLLNALYLAGDFGVALEPVCLVPREEVGAFEAYEENLLPYYAGAITYTTEFELEEVPAGGRAIVEFDYGEPFQEASEVSINGSEYKPVLWEPRCVMLPTAQLRKGANILSTRVHTTLVRSFEGQWFDYRQHTYRAVGE